MKKPFTFSAPFSALTARESRAKLSTGLVFLSISTTQIGAALAKLLFPALGPLGTVSLRVGWAAILLLIFWRPRLRGAYNRSAYVSVLLFGLILALMNLSFYAALGQIPLGVTVTLEFIGPLLIAVVQSRRVLDLIWVLLAAGGVLLLAPINIFGAATALSLPGIGCALFAGLCWAGYILLSARVGSVFPGGIGLTFATTIAAVTLLPFGIAQSAHLLQDPLLLLYGAGVGLLSSALPYTLEMEALRHLPTRVFSILLSMEPVIATLVGLIVLHEYLTLRSLIAIILICCASSGVIFFQGKKSSGPDVGQSEKSVGGGGGI